MLPSRLFMYMNNAPAVRHFLYIHVTPTINRIQCVF